MIKFAYLIVAVALVGCSTTKESTQTPATETKTKNENSEIRMASNFQRRGIKVEWSKNNLNSIEVTGFAPAYGNSPGNQEKAFRIAELDAKAKLRKFIHEEISTETVVKTFSRNLEKANNKLQSNKNNEPVEASDDESITDTNSTTNETNNLIARRMTNIIRSNASGILRGVYTVNEQMADRQVAMVVVRWDNNSDEAAKFLRKKFGE